MSIDYPASGPASGALNLEQLRKRAKELKKAVAQGGASAALRVLRANPKVASTHSQLAGQDIPLATAQLAVAREAGYASWPRLRRALAMADLDRRDAEHALVAAALAGDDARVDAVRERWPELAAASTPCALVLADARAPARLTAATVNRAMAPRGWPPLLYLCNSRYRAGNATTANAQLGIANALFALGADASAGAPEAQTIRGYRTALGAAIGRARNPQLAAALLAAGAGIDDGPTLYEGCAMWEAVRLRDIASLRTLLAAEPPQWHVCHALPHALQFNDSALVRLLLDNGGDPNWTMGVWGFDGNCLHEAVVLDSDPTIVAELLAGGAQVDFRDRDGRTPLAVATCLNRQPLAALLREHGADESGIREVDRWVAACFAGDGATARQLAAGTRLRGHLKTADHLWLCRAIRAGDDAAAQLLLAGGMDPDAMDDDGERPLHLAAANGNVAAAGHLLAVGADPAATNFAGGTPLDCALGADPEVRDEIAELLVRKGSASGASFDDAEHAALFEQAADAVVDGDLDSLRTLLAEHPALARARSPRPHRCTLLHYLGANGVEGERQKTPANAVAVIDLLIEAGADANAVCFTYRGGPQQNTMGLLTSSGHPKQAGLTLAMVSALARGGAKLDDVYALLAQLFNAKRAGDLAGAVATLDPAADLAGGALVEVTMLGDTDILLALLAAGVDINARRGDGATALHQAAIEGDAERVDDLLSRGADLRLRDNVYDGTAAGWAYAGGHEALGAKLAERLKQLGTDEL